VLVVLFFARFGSCLLVLNDEFLAWRQGLGGCVSSRHFSVHGALIRGRGRAVAVSLLQDSI
jgi:hypothetical protein